MKTIRNFVLVIIIWGFQVVNTYSMTESASIDSIYNLIKGNWYEVIVCNGYVGKCDSVYSDDIQQIERIAGTDSITWKVFSNGTMTHLFKYLISYSESLILNQNRWMLINNGLKRIIEINNNIFFCDLDAFDGDGIGYSRTKLVTGIINQTIDNSQLSVFPNPTNSSFVIKGVENIERVDIIDINGKILLSKVNKDAIGTIDISILSNGIYFVRAFSTNKSYNEKIIKN